MDEEEEFAIAEAIKLLANQVKYLGNGNAATSMGAIEALGVVHKDGLDAIASAISDHATAMSEIAAALNRIADNMTNPE